MVHEEFLQLLSKVEGKESGSYDIDAFDIYLDKINGFLDEFFSNPKYSKTYSMLKQKAEGLTLQDIGKEYGITRERVRQIIGKTISKMNNSSIVEGNPSLRNMFSFLCGIGESEINEFISFLKTKNHILLLILGIKSGVKKPKPKQYKKKELKPFASNREIQQALILFISEHTFFHTLIDIVNAFENETRKKDSYLSGRITWHKILTILIEMNENQIIEYKSGKYILKR